MRKRSIIKEYGLEKGLQENAYWGVVTIKEIMNKDLRTYTSINLADLQVQTSKLSKLDK